MINKFWFKPKIFGYGLVPVSIEGWIATFVFISILLLKVYSLGFFDGYVSFSNSSEFLVDLVILSVLFLLLFKDKTDGDLRWRWGK